MTYAIQPRRHAPDVKTPLTPKRPGRVRENDEYAAFARRVLRAYARRIADGDIEALTLMIISPTSSTTPSARPSTACASSGYSWAEIGSRLGITRQAAWQRWGGKP